MDDIWLLTEEYNRYDQLGEYFVRAFKEFPTFEQLLAAEVPEQDLTHVRNGGGRKATEDHWFHLRRHKLT